MRAGKTNSAHSIVKVIAMVKSSPMLAGPRPAVAAEVPAAAAAEPEAGDDPKVITWPKDGRA